MSVPVHLMILPALAVPIPAWSTFLYTTQLRMSLKPVAVHAAMKLPSETLKAKKLAPVP